MPSDLLPIFIALALLIAFVAAARGYLLFGAIQARADEVQLRGAALAARTAGLREGHALLQAQIAELNTELERALWAVPRFDSRADRAEAALRQRRASIERVRVRYLEGSRQGLDRLRQTVTLLKQLHQLRRTFLG